MVQCGHIMWWERFDGSCTIWWVGQRSSVPAVGYEQPTSVRGSQELDIVFGFANINTIEIGDSTLKVKGGGAFYGQFQSASNQVDVWIWGTECKIFNLTSQSDSMTIKLSLIQIVLLSTVLESKGLEDTSFVGFPLSSCLRMTLEHTWLGKPASNQELHRMCLPTVWQTCQHIEMKVRTGEWLKAYWASPQRSADFQGYIGLESSRILGVPHKQHRCYQGTDCRSTLQCRDAFHGFSLFVATQDEGEHHRKVSTGVDPTCLSLQIGTIANNVHMLSTDTR